MPRAITDLPHLIVGLPSAERQIADRILEVQTTTGRLEEPEAMRPWIERTFGSVDAVR